VFFLYSLVCDADKRLGRGGIRDFKLHPFFEGIDWENILDSKCHKLIVIKMLPL